MPSTHKLHTDDVDPEKIETRYVQEIDEVIAGYSEDLEEDYGDNIIFVKAYNEVHEKTWRIDL